MALNSPSVALTLNVLTTVPDPTAQWGAPASAVQLQNATPFVLQVVIDGEQWVIQSFTAQTLPTAGSGTSLTVLPTSGPAGTQGGLVVVWLDKGEAPPMTDGQLTGAAQYAVGLGTQVLAPTNGTANGAGLIANTVTPAPTARTLLVRITKVSGSAAWPSLIVQGLTTLYNYHGGLPNAGDPFYLSNQTTGWLAVVPINAAIDPTYLVSVQVQPGDVYTVAIVADTAFIDESQYMNGQVLKVTSQSLAVSTTANLVVGPCRLLTLAVEAFPNTTGFVTLGSQSILRVDAQASAQSVTADFSFPPFTVLPEGSGLVLNSVTAGNAVVGMVSYVYP